MGGFSSRGGNASQNNAVQEVTVEAHGKAQQHPEPAVASQQPISNGVSSSSKPRPDIERAPQNSSNQRSSGAAGDRSGQGAARPKNGHGSLRVKDGDQNEDWNEVLGDMPFGNAEEEEMQRAIEASIMESHTRSASVPIDRFSHNTSSQARKIAANNQQTGENVPEDLETPHGAGQPRGRQGPAKAATSGLKGGGWVDNSDFMPGAGGSSNSSQAKQRCRSVPASSRSGMPVGGSGIVTLPRIAQPVPAQQQEMVKELHEKIKSATGEDQHQSGSSQDPRNGGARDHEMKRPKKGVDVRSLMEENDMDDMSLAQINGGGHRQQERFNENFASCAGGGRESDRSGARNSQGFR